MHASARTPPAIRSLPPAADPRPQSTPHPQGAPHDHPPDPHRRPRRRRARRPGRPGPARRHARVHGPGRRAGPASRTCARPTRVTRRRRRTRSAAPFSYAPGAKPSTRRALPPAGQPTWPVDPQPIAAPAQAARHRQRRLAGARDPAGRRPARRAARRIAARYGVRRSRPPHPRRRLSHPNAGSSPRARARGLARRPPRASGAARAAPPPFSDPAPGAAYRAPRGGTMGCGA